MRESRRYVVTSAGEKQYVTEADIKTEVYCDVCERAFGPDEDYIYLQIRGGWNRKPVSIPGYSEVVLLHEDCTPNMIMHMMQPVVRS